MLFKELQLNAKIQKVLEEQHYNLVTPIQEKAIPLLLQGKDLLGCAETGTGKTAAFGLPIIEKLAGENRVPGQKRYIRALILAPTRELAIQIEKSFELYGKYLDLQMLVIYGGVSAKRQMKGINREPDILIATPGRLIDLMEQSLLDLSHIKILVLDEADRMLDLGMSKDVIKILSWLPEKRQTILFSATMSNEVTGLVNSILKDPVKIHIKENDREKINIRENLYFVEESYKTALLLKLLKDESLESVLIFTKTQRRADQVCKVIQKANIRTKAIHGGRKQQARQDALEMFKTKSIRILVATDIAARGIDVLDLSHVINMDLPQVPETYIHRIGRTGRAGKFGQAISFCSQYEVELLQGIEKHLGHQLIEVENHEFLPLHMAIIRNRNDYE